MTDFSGNSLPPALIAPMNIAVIREITCMQSLRYVGYVTLESDTVSHSSNSTHWYWQSDMCYMLDAAVLMNSYDQAQSVRGVSNKWCRKHTVRQQLQQSNVMVIRDRKGTLTSLSRAARVTSCRAAPCRV